MMSDKQPPKAMAWICDLKLFFVVFACPENPRPHVDEHCDRFVFYLMKFVSLYKISPIFF